MSDEMEDVDSTDLVNSRNKPRTNVRRACDLCRDKRKKCDGKNPCSSCRRAHKLCAYAEREDRRGRLPSDAATQQLLRHKLVLGQLMQAIEDGNESHFLPLIRRGTSLSQLQDSLATYFSDGVHFMPQSETGFSSASPVTAKSSNSLFLGTRVDAEEDLRRLFQIPLQNFGNLPFSAALMSNSFPASVQALQIRNYNAPEWATFPLMMDDGSPLGNVCTEFVRVARNLIASGTPSQLIIGQDISLTEVTLFFRDRTATDPITASGWACEVAKTFGGSFSHLLLLSSLFMLSRWMRWIIVSDAKIYAEVPPMMRPTLKQRFVPHSAAIGLMPLPGIRDALIDSMRDYAAICAQAGLDVKWDRPFLDALICTAPLADVIRGAPGSVYLSPVFTDHITHSSNWTIGRLALTGFPEISEADLTISQDDVVRLPGNWFSADLDETTQIKKELDDT